MRYERKIPIICPDVKIIRHQVRLHPAGFREIYHSREINNIYFETPSLDCGMANVEGERNRWKIRIRWYGLFFTKISSPRLELKIKQDHLGYKKRFSLPPFTVKKQFDTKRLRVLMLHSSIPKQLRDIIMVMHPVLVNSYLRTYFLSTDSRFRLTLDSDLMWGSIPSSGSGIIHRQREANSVILELKYDRDNDDDAETITNKFPWRVSKNSKYINALSRLYR